MNGSVIFICLTLAEEEDEEEDEVEVDEVDEVHTESSCEEEEESETASQQTQQDTVPKDTSTVSQTNPGPSLSAPSTVANQVTIWTVFFYYLLCLILSSK